jgi:hypothetical protein
MSVGATLYMRNSTIANNRGNGASVGAGLYCAAAAVCNLGNNILADNIATSNPDLFVVPGGTLDSVGGNLVESTMGYNNGAFDQPNDLLNVDPMLMVLADNGGNVPTMRIEGNSPAANAGWNPGAIDPFTGFALTTDARGEGFPRIQSGVVDKGAFEVPGTTAARVSISGRVLANRRALRNARVVLTDQYGASRTVTTGSFGHFMFEGIDAGQTVVIRVVSRRYQFNAQVMVVVDNLTDLEFNAIEEQRPIDTAH